MKGRFALLGVSAVLVFSAAAQQQLTIDQVMTSNELKSTGVSALTQAQRAELDRLTRYTYLLLADQKKSTACDPTIETQIDGDFKGWSGETIYRLRNGQIWQQAAYTITITITMLMRLR